VRAQERGPLRSSQSWEVSATAAGSSDWRYDPDHRDGGTNWRAAGPTQYLAGMQFATVAARLSRRRWRAEFVVEMQWRQRDGDVGRMRCETPAEGITHYRMEPTAAIGG